jgi:hypothetical protein
MNGLTDLVAVECVVMYWYNQEPETIMLAVFPGAHPRYLAEKVTSYQDGFLNFWGRLDWDHKSRLLMAARQKYQEQVEPRVTRYFEVPCAP